MPDTVLRAEDRDDWALPFGAHSLEMETDL